MSDDGGSVSDVDYTTPHSRVGASGAEDDGPGDRGDSTQTPRRAIPRRRASEYGPRRQFESPAKVEMGRKHNANSQTMIRPKRAMAIDVATLRHVFERIDKNGDGEIDPAEFLEAWSDDPEVAELLTVGSDIACSTDSIDAAEKLRRAQNIFDKIDADQSTRVTFGEFKRYFELRAKMPAKAENAPKQATPLSLDAPLEFMIETLKQFFDMIDKDRDGEISMVELSQAWMNENIGQRLYNTWLAYPNNKKQSRVDTVRVVTHIQNIFLRIEADRNETAGVTFSEFVRYFQVKDTPQATEPGERKEAIIHQAVEPVSRPYCLSFCTGSASAEAAMRYAESIRMPQPRWCFFCCVW